MPDLFSGEDNRIELLKMLRALRPSGVWMPIGLLSKREDCASKSTGDATWIYARSKVVGVLDSKSNVQVTSYFVVPVLEQVGPLILVSEACDEREILVLHLEEQSYHNTRLLNKVLVGCPSLIAVIEKLESRSHPNLESNHLKLPLHFRSAAFRTLKSMPEYQVHRTQASLNWRDK